MTQPTGEASTPTAPGEHDDREDLGAHDDLTLDLLPPLDGDDEPLGGHDDVLDDPGDDDSEDDDLVVDPLANELPTFDDEPTGSLDDMGDDALPIDDSIEDAPPAGDDDGPELADDDPLAEEPASPSDDGGDGPDDGSLDTELPEPSTRDAPLDAPGEAPASDLAVGPARLGVTTRRSTSRPPPRSTDAA